MTLQQDIEDESLTFDCHLDPQIKAAWIELLEDPGNTQAFGVLKYRGLDGPGYCCLGLLSDKVPQVSERTFRNTRGDTADFRDPHAENWTWDSDTGRWVNVTDYDAGRKPEGNEGTT